MIGYGYLDLDSRFIHKTQDYIENVDPGFFSKNRVYILKHWKFDTEDRSSMIRMLREASDLDTPESTIRLFLRSIDYDLSKLAERP